MTQQVLTEIQDQVIIIRLNRADKKNALTGDMYTAISDALEQLESDSNLRVGLITGTEECFTAGNDLVDFMQGGGVTGDSPVGRFLATMPFINLGLCPEAGSSLLLPQLVGYRKATELLMLCEGFGAEEALAMGIVNQVVPADQYQALALEKAHRLAKQPPSSIRAAKKLMRMGQDAALKAVMTEEARLFTEMLSGAEAKEAFAAFFEKRKPDFSRF